MSEKEDLSQTEPLSENLVRSCKIKNQLSNFIEWLRPPAAFCKCICRTNSIKARSDIPTQTTKALLRGILRIYEHPATKYLAKFTILYTRIRYTLDSLPLLDEHALKSERTVLCSGCFP